MFSEIVKISSTAQRQKILRSSNDQDKESGRSHDQNQPDETADTATVSIAALKTFLEKFIQNKMGRNNAQEGANRRKDFYASQSEFDFQRDPPKPSTAAARAASAYQSMDRAKQKRQTLLETTDQGNGPAIEIDANDVLKIHAMIEDLKHLEHAKIEYIHIERAQSFVQSIENAIQKIKNGLKI